MAIVGETERHDGDTKQDESGESDDWADDRDDDDDEMQITAAAVIKWKLIPGARLPGAGLVTGGEAATTAGIIAGEYHQWSFVQPIFVRSVPSYIIATAYLIRQLVMEMTRLHHSPPVLTAPQLNNLAAHWNTTFSV